MLIVFFMHAFCLVSFWKTCCACIMQPFLSMISSNIHSFCVHSLILCKIYHTNRRASFPFLLCVCLIVHQKYGSQCSVKHFIVYLFLYMLAVCIYILNSQLAFILPSNGCGSQFFTFVQLNQQASSIIATHLSTLTTLIFALVNSIS